MLLVYIAVSVLTACLLMLMERRETVEEHPYYTCRTIRAPENWTGPTVQFHAWGLTPGDTHTHMFIHPKLPMERFVVPNLAQCVDLLTGDKFEMWTKDDVSGGHGNIELGFGAAQPTKQEDADHDD